MFQKGSCRELEAGTVDSQGLGASPGWRTPGLAAAGSLREPVALAWAGRQGSHLLFIPPSWPHKPGAGGRALGCAVYKRLATRTQRRVGRWKGGLGGKQYPVESTHQTGT